MQLQVFKAEVEQQRLIPTLRSFLKLYTSIPISKLAKFLDMHENEVRCCLMAFKHKKEVVSDARLRGRTVLAVLFSACHSKFVAYVARDRLGNGT